MANAKRRRVKIEAALGASLLSLVKNGLGRKEDKKTLSDIGWVRASAFAALCPREEVICSLKDVQREDNISSDLDLIFSHGHALHFWAQNYMVPNAGDGVLLGRWTCVGCGKLIGKGKDPYGPAGRKVVPRPSACPECGHDGLFLYKELLLKSREYRIQGHTDGILSLPGKDGLGVLELKSISSYGFRGVRNVPDLSHYIQAHIYMWLTGLKWGVILYWDKGGKDIDALKEHFIERDDSVVDDIKGILRQIWGAIDGKSAVPSRICENETCARAKSCVVKDLCFSAEFDSADEEELDDPDAASEEITW